VRKPTGERASEAAEAGPPASLEPIRHRGHKSHAEEGTVGRRMVADRGGRTGTDGPRGADQAPAQGGGWSQAELGEKVGTDAGRISRYEGGRITPSIDALMRIAEVFNVSADHLLFDDVPRRPLHSAEDALGDRLAVIGELSADDLASLLNVVDGLVAKSRLRAMAGDLG